MQRIKKRQEIWSYLQQIIPLKLAGSWDNVGILVDPAPIHEGDERIFLTIDLTEAVLEEALAWNASIIIAYHPPIFSGLKTLSIHRNHSNLLVRAIQAGIGIYSPHSALDAVSGGMCDWLSAIFATASLNQKFTNNPTFSF